jgi:hypothetical protein
MVRWQKVQPKNSKSSNAAEEKTRPKFDINLSKVAEKVTTFYFKYEEPNRMLWHNLFVKIGRIFSCDWPETYALTYSNRGEGRGR